MSADAAARRRITTDLDETLFVEAGAGTGKTTALVGRVVALVEAGIPLREIAAITFTEAAAAELRHRLRDELEQARRSADDGELVRRYEQALDEADVAAISTLHSFAQRVLREHPVEVGLPPRIEVADEVQSQLAFARRWIDFLDTIVADPEMTRVVEWAYLLDIRIAGTLGASLEKVARLLDQSWDRLEGAAREPRELPVLDRAPLAAAVAAAQALDVAHECSDPADRLAVHLGGLEADLDRLAAVLATGRDDDVLAALQVEVKWTCSNGKQANWSDVVAARALLTAVDVAVRDLRRVAVNAVLRIFASELAQATLAAARARQEDGVLEFHDLLVLARRLLREHPRARAALHERYRRLLVDEFQDTDPLQVELAVLIAAGVGGEAAGDAEHPGPWQHTGTEPGRLFFVGDPKQSIYRFRRADIRVFLEARDRFAGAAPVHLTRSFRTEPTVLRWVNDVFGQIMDVEVEGRQPAYEPLEAACAPDPDHDHRVLLLGGPHDRDEGLRAADLRELEATDIAAVIDTVRADPDAWTVRDPRSGEPRPARLDDVTILVPTRVSLRYLRAALAARDIPHRLDTGSLVFDSPEVREILAVLRALADPTDSIALVAALRAPAFACADDELFEYYAAGGRWDLRAGVPPGLDDAHPVVIGLRALRGLHELRHWTEPAELIGRIVRERRVLELGFGQPRPRDVWRRVRYLVDQARAYTESQQGDLAGFLDWVELATAEGSRVHEPVLAEPDDESVRIMTIHGAKGLEFPITVVAGTSTLHTKAGARFGVHWGDEAGLPEVALRTDVATDSFDRLADIESEMDSHEKQRLLYVALTRARDYLIVGAHHLAGRESFAATAWRCSVGEDPGADDPAPAWRHWEPDETPVPIAPEVRETFPVDATVMEDREAWIDEHARLLARGARPRTISATRLVAAEAGAPMEPDVAVDAADASVGPAPWRRGRGGTAFGRAVHGVLQVVDLATGAGVQDLAVAQCALEGLGEAVDDVVRAVESALAAPIVRRAVGGRCWREAYVAVPAGDGVLEGYVDLLVETEDGLVVVDYKTDRVEDEAEARRRAVHYGPQGAAYAAAVADATGRAVTDCIFLFTRPGGAIEQRLEDLAGAVARVRGRLEVLTAG